MSNVQLPSLSQKRLLFLDYLRVFAFLSVLIGHKFYDQLLSIIDNSSIYSAPKLLVTFLLPFFMGGGAGVVVFFIVSGYIITRVLTFETTTSFLVKRIFRIYPLYIAAVLIQISLSSSHTTPKEIIVQKYY